MTPNHDPNDMRVSDQQSNPLFSRAADFFPIQLATPHQYYTYDPVFFRSQYCLYDPNWLFLFQSSKSGAEISCRLANSVRATCYLHV